MFRRSSPCLPAYDELGYGRAMGMHRHHLGQATLLAVAGFLASCTITLGEPDAGSETSEPATSVSVPTPSSSPPSGAQAPAISAPGRLAIVDDGGSLFTTMADGSDRVELVGTGDTALTASQPAWSPDGTLLAWVVSDVPSASITGAIVVAGPRGEDPIVTPTPFVPFYLSWSPTGDRVAFLGAGSDTNSSVQMGVLDLGDAQPQVRPVAAGDPFLYFAWAPDGKGVLAHAGFDRLERIDLAGGKPSPLTSRPGLFATPDWSDDGRTLVYVERGPDGEQRLVSVVNGKQPRTLVEGKGALSFVLTSDGRSVAYQMLGERDGDLFDRRPTEPRDGVHVVDLRSGVDRRVTSIRAMTFWWSPDGERLLTLAPEPASDGAIPFLWQVWDGQRVIDVAGRHSPTLVLLREYAPFFTQYAQSATPWSPDATAFAFPVTAPDGSSQIVVQEVGGEPSVIGDGVYVTWSP